jgi:hypothetical protein
MSLWERLVVAARIAEAWEAVRTLPVQAVASLPAFVVRVGGGRYEVGPIPVRRLE